MNTVTRLKTEPRQRQQGAVVIMFGLTLVVLIGFVGLVVDLGRFFVIKAELQNAMDACALSAASQLSSDANDTVVSNRARAYGKVFFTTDRDAVTNKVNFQSKVPNPDDLLVTFASSNAGPFTLTVPNEAQYVKCEYPLAGLPIYFMRVLNILPGVSIAETQKVTAMAVAKRQLPLASCIPVAVCAPSTGTPANNFGYTVGEWLIASDSPASYGTGHFGWASLIAGNADQLGSELMGSPQCDIGQIGQPVYGTGVISSLPDKWNTRFGLYRSNPTINPSNAPPDHTGYAYSDETGGNWPPIPPETKGFNAYSGSNSLSPTVPNFESSNNNGWPYNTVASPNPAPVQAQPPGFPINQFPNVLDQAEHLSMGRINRRVVTAPVVDCTAWAGNPSAQVLTKGFACVLMLNPFDNSGPSNAAHRKAKLEFLGLADDPNSPCAGGETGAFAPVLTQ